MFDKKVFAGPDLKKRERRCDMPSLPALALEIVS